MGSLTQVCVKCHKTRYLYPCMCLMMHSMWLHLRSFELCFMECVCQLFLISSSTISGWVVICTPDRCLIMHMVWHWSLVMHDWFSDKLLFMPILMHRICVHGHCSVSCRKISLILHLIIFLNPFWGFDANTSDFWSDILLLTQITPKKLCIIIRKYEFQMF